MRQDAALQTATQAGCSESGAKMRCKKCARLSLHACGGLEATEKTRHNRQGWHPSLAPGSHSNKGAGGNGFDRAIDMSPINATW